jgi:threonyl-tRNA synthetase
MPIITLPNGAQKEFAQPVSVADVALSIGAGLAKAALAGKIGGQLVDTSHVITDDAALSIITEKDADGLEVLRHSCAHLLAMAVQDLFPTAQVTIGPVIEDGFYYDFAFERPFTMDDLAKIEARMEELAAKDFAVSRSVMSRPDAIRLFERRARSTRSRSLPASPAPKTCPSTARATSLTCAAARTCPAPASSRPSS